MKLDQVELIELQIQENKLGKQNLKKCFNHHFTVVIEMHLQARMLIMTNLTTALWGAHIFLKSIPTSLFATSVFRNDTGTPPLTLYLRL